MFVFSDTFRQQSNKILATSDKKSLTTTKLAYNICKTMTYSQWEFSKIEQIKTQNSIPMVTSNLLNISKMDSDHRDFFIFNNFHFLPVRYMPDNFFLRKSIDFPYGIKNSQGRSALRLDSTIIKQKTFCGVYTSG